MSTLSEPLKHRSEVPIPVGRVLVCGDAMADIYWRGHVSGVSPEAPVTVVKVTDTERRDGAAANVANNIEAMGILCERFFGASQERIQKIRLMSGSQHLTRIDFDHRQTPIQNDAAFEDALGRCAYVVMVDYGKGSLDNAPALIAKARAMNRYILVDPKGHNFEKYRGAHLIKPNRDEMKELVGGWSTNEELEFKARQFLIVSGIEAILLTQAAEGMTLYNRLQTHHRPAGQGPVVDVSGAGEAALCGYTAAIARGYSVNRALDFASAAAAICISRPGTTVVNEEELNARDSLSRNV